MALKSTIYKIQLQVSDFDREYYQTHGLTLARHPSETDERMMVRVLAFALNASAELSFGAGLSADEQADLWAHDLTGAIRLWIDVGQPDLKLVRRAAGRAARVIVYSFGRSAGLWWKNHQSELARIDHLSVLRIEPEDSQALAALAQRTMTLQCLVQDGAVSLLAAERSLELRCHVLKRDVQ